MAKTKSKFFRAFVEGATISDGRKITGQMIDEIVATFNRDTYSPRCNVEHIAGYSPEPPFNGYGDVFAVRAQDDDIVIDGKTQKLRALYCQVDANEQLVDLANRDQKPFPSVELTDSYASTGKVGLVGLAFTDSPASIATQRLQFSRSAPGTVHVAGADALAIEFEVDPTASADPGKVEGAIAGFFSALTARFAKSEPEPKKEEPQAPPPAANDNNLSAFATAMGETVAKSIAAAIKPLADAQTGFAADLASLKADVEKTPAPGGFSRQPATGGTTTGPQTDC